MASQNDILDHLNEDQRAAVVDYMGPCFILAGPGAGKTMTVVSRAQYMIAVGNIDPSEILLFTFTNKAAKEIKERVAAKIGDDGKRITVGTYHSICSRILRQYCEYIGYKKNFTIFDSEDSTNLLKKLVKGTDYKPSAIAEFISSRKNSMITTAMAQQNAKNTDERNAAEFYNAYQDELFKQGAMDFDDLIFNTIMLFERNPEVLKAINSKYKYIIADEAHDSAPRDLRLIELLGGDTKNVCMILDDDQSIYAFRGVKIDSVLNMNKIYPELKTFILRRNYRSTQIIVNASRSLISYNKDKLEKPIFTENADGVPIMYYEEMSQRNEADRIVKLIKFLHDNVELQYQEIAILYRMSYQSRNLEEGFIRNTIPYKIVGGLPFYCRKEIKDILSYVRILTNPFDFEAYKRAMSVPSRGIAATTADKVLAYSRNTYSQPIDLIQASNEIVLKGKIGSALKEWGKQLADLHDKIETMRPADFIKMVIDQTGYRDDLLKNDEANACDRIENLMELQTISEYFDTMEEFIQATCLDSQINDEEQESEDYVQMMTMHASKGLEFRAVIIVDIYEGVNPHYKAVNLKDIEEERRLFYVAMTRAKEFLFFTRPKFIFQQGQTVATVESRFAKEIDKQYVKKYAYRK